MPVLFPTIYQIIRRQKGGYVNGVWSPAVENPPENMELDIQPANDFDYQRTQIIAQSVGQRVTAMVTATAPLAAGLRVAGSHGYPGDIVLYNDERWIVIGSARFDSLGIGSDTAHMRYLLTLEAEHSAGENIA